MAQMVMTEKDGRVKDTYKLDKPIFRKKNNPKEEEENEIMLKKLSILVVDDDSTIRELFKRLLEGKGHSVDVAEDGYKGVEKAKERNYQIAFIDIVMPGINGYKTFLEIKKINPGIKAVIMTGYSVESIVKEAMQKEAYACIYKPFARSEVLDLIKKILNGV